MSRIAFCLLLFTFFLLAGAGCEPQKQPTEPGKIESEDVDHTAGEPADIAQEPAEPNAPQTNEIATEQPEEPNEPEQSTQANVPEAATAAMNDVNDVQPDIPEPNGPIISEPNEDTSIPDSNTPAPVEDVNEPTDVEAVTEPNDTSISAAVDANETAVVNVEPVEPNIPVEPNNAAEPDDAFCKRFTDFFDTYVNSKGLVDYQSLRRHRLQLKKLLDEFDELDRDVYKDWAQDQQMAFWINAYNMNLLNIIAQNYPIQASRWFRLIYGPNSIRHISGIETDYKFMVMREEFTLRQIREKIFRGQFNDPRVFLALSMACMSGPPLRDEPYCGRKLDRQLDEQVKDFLSEARSFEVDAVDGEVRLNALFQANDLGKYLLEKYATDRKFKDHGPEMRAVLNFISKYVPENVVSYMETGNYSVRFSKFDWTVNHQP